jgi:hypothetical protein
MFTNKKSLLALSVASALVLSGCNDNDNNDPVPPVEEPVVVVVAPEAPAELGSVVSGNVVDANDSAALPSTIAFYEDDVTSENIVDVDGNVTATIDSEDGGFVFQIKEGADLSQITAVVTSENYVSKAFVVDLSGIDSGDVSVELNLTSTDTAGIAVSDPVVASISEDGTSATDIEVSVDNSDGATSKVTIPANTVLQNANGDPVTGSVTVKVITAKPGSVAAAAIVPQGLNKADSTTILTPSGVTSVEMVNSDGVKIKKFSSPINLDMAVRASSPATLGLSSQNEDTGKWTTEAGNVTVANGVGSFTTDHLTFFAGTTASAVCATPVRFLFSGDTAAIPNPSGLRLRISSSDIDHTLSDVKGNLTIAGPLVSLIGISDTAETRLRVRDLEGNLWYDSVTEVAICGDVNIALDAPEITYQSETLALSAVCSNGTDVSVGASGALVKYSRNGKGIKVAKGDGAGNYALNNMQDGETYNVSVKYKGTLSALGTVAYTVTADGTDEEQSESIVCNETTGGTGGTGGS